jgi:ATP-binding cassette subfamily C (CFTR/MRP) protein 1
VAQDDSFNKRRLPVSSICLLLNPLHKKYRLLLKAQLKDAEDAIKVLEKDTPPKRSIDENDRRDGQEEKVSPSSLLSLRRVCMHCKPGEFVAVIGGVGSGKSTLINSILGEGRPLTGSELAVKGKLGVFLQTPFIMNDTVRENILFGHTGLIDEERYQLALKVCSLGHDLKLLTHGDQTEIGEKGITLSGGQKARVALARAVYHDADIYLLDDPLAAVDAHVGKDLFNKCIVDELLLGKSKVKELEQNGEQTQNVAEDSRGWTDMLLGRSPSKLGADGGGPRTRRSSVILVTNALQHLSHPMVDKILVLGDGCVQEVGTFVELSANHNSRFAAFLKTMAETSTATIDQVPSDAATEVSDGNDASEDNLDFNYGGDEPEVTKIIRAEHRQSRSGSIKLSSMRRLDISEENDENLKGDDSGAIMTVEEKVTGSVDWRVYIAWAKAGGGASVVILILGLFVVVELINVASKWWLTYWSQSGGSHAYFYLGIYGTIS